MLKVWCSEIFFDKAKACLADATGPKRPKIGLSSVQVECVKIFVEFFLILCFGFGFFLELVVKATIFSDGFGFALRTLRFFCDDLRTTLCGTFGIFLAVLSSMVIVINPHERRWKAQGWAWL